MRYEFGGLIFGGAYEWRGLFSEFDGILVAHALYGEYMLKFCKVCILNTRLQSEIPRTQSHLHCLREQAAKDGRTTRTFGLKCPSTTSPAAFYLSYVTVCLCAGPSKESRYCCVHRYQAV